MIGIERRDASMLMNDEWIAVIEQAEELTEMLLSSDIINSYQKAHNDVYSDAKLAKSIHEFTEMKERYEEVQRFGRYHPDYNIVMKSIRVMKRELDMNEQVALLRLTENDAQHLFNEVSSIIAKSVSEFVKVPTGNAFFVDSSCAGGCGSGGSCSCSA